MLPAEQNARLSLEISHRSYVFEIGRIALLRLRFTPSPVSEDALPKS
jgi:ABC-type branched-subunit amino acid transport system ATPase component